MKKTLIICLLALTYTNAQAQTMEQTINWINSKTGSIPWTKQAEYFSLKPVYPNDIELTFPQKQGGSGGYVEDVRRINLSSITGISFMEYQYENDGIYKHKLYNLYLSGPTRVLTNSQRQEYIEVFTDVSQLQTARVKAGTVPNIRLSYAVSEDEIKKIKKAYEHLAKLCGAKLVDEDLFKN
jgi:hypothetical protein